MKKKVHIYSQCSFLSYLYDSLMTNRDKSV